MVGDEEICEERGEIASDVQTRKGIWHSFGRLGFGFNCSSSYGRAKQVCRRQSPKWPCPPSTGMKVVGLHNYSPAAVYPAGRSSACTIVCPDIDWKKIGIHSWMIVTWVVSVSRYRKKAGTDAFILTTDDGVCTIHTLTREPVFHTESASSKRDLI